MQKLFYQAIDENILFFFQSIHNDVLNAIFWSISEGWVFIPLWLFALYKIYQQHPSKNYLKIVFMVAISIALSDQTANVFKYRIKRLRPTHNEMYQDKIHLVNNYKGGTYGFYSAHASNSASIAILALLLIKHSRWKYLMLIYPLLSGTSRMYLAVHYFSDVLVGWIMGILIGWIIYKVFQRFLYQEND